MLVAACLVLALAGAGHLVSRAWVDVGQGRAARTVASTTCALALGVGAARTLAAFGHLRLAQLLTALGAVAVAAFLDRRRGAARPPGMGVGSLLRSLDVSTALVLVVAGAAVVVAAAAARLLPIWAWDAAGYHLPFVNLVVQSGSAATVPDGLTYVSAYPHNAEYLFALLRLGLPDDTWLDGAQILFGVVGAGVTAAMAKRWGATAPTALAAGALWLTLPAVFLQMPTGYIDVCVAAFFLLAAYWVAAAPTPAGIVMAGLALGLLLGSKPSAPAPVACLSVILTIRALRARQGRWLLAAFGALAVLGAPDYVANIRRFHNPVWPIAVDLGPIHWPGRASVADLLAAGAAAPRLTGPLWSRVLRSWTSLRAPAAFDMRFGGLGSAVVLVAFPAIAWSARRVPRLAWLVMLASLAAPDPATARFILAFPALCLAVAASGASSLPPWLTRIALAACAALSALDLRYAAPALTGDGPSLTQLASMTDEQRLRAVGPDGPPGPWIDLRRALRPGEAIAFDRTFDLSYLLWRRHLENAVVFVPDEASRADVERLLTNENVRFLVAGGGSAAEAVAKAPGRNHRRLFACRAEPCAVYELATPNGRPPELAP
jgi:hypothetical protein